MAQLDIKALTDIIREFDGQVTVRGLSSDLGISYSTFARANRSGVWPRSLADGCVLAVLDDCRMRYFGGDGRSLADFILAQLHIRGVAATALEEAFDQDGYDAFLTEFLAQAHAANVEGAVVRLVPVPKRSDAPVVEDHSADSDAQMSATAEARTDRTRNLVFALPVAAVLLMGVLNMSLTSAYAWATSNRVAFLVISVTIALLPAFVGIFVDSPLAWRAWRADHPDVSFSWDAYRRVAKYGAPEGIVPDAGRFNLTLPYLTYQPVCNLAAAMCCQSLLALMLSLPGFDEFFRSHEWVEYLKVGIVVSYYVAWEFLCDQCHKPLTGDPNSEVCENPDNYLPSRAHVWANTLHLVWVISIVIIGLLCVLAYSIVNFRVIPAPSILVRPYAMGVLFFLFSSLSPYAVRTRATGIGVFVPGVVSISVGFFVLAAVCYLPSTAGLALCVACVACCVGALAWARRASKGGMAEWLSAWRAAGVYPVIIAVTIFVLLALGFVTLAFA